MRLRTAVGAVSVAAVLAGGLTVVAVRRDGAPAARGPATTPTASPSPRPTGPADPSAEPIPSPHPLAAAGAPATASGVSRALAAALADPALGSRVSAVVADAGTGATLYARNAGLPVVPASTAKIPAALTALRVLGPDHRIPTRAYVRGALGPDGTVTGDLVLVGGGDSTLATPAARSGYPSPARLDTLAARVRAAGVRRVTGGILVDGTVFGGARLGPGWKPTYVSEGSVAPVTGLMADSGKLRPDVPESRAADPDLAAGRSFKVLLQKAGVTVGGPVVRGVWSGAEAPALAEVHSPPVAALVERLLTASDNNLAEALVRLAAAASGHPASFDGAAAAMRDVLGLDAAGLVDGSGLSPRNRLTTGALVRMLALAAEPDHPELRPVLTGLPVAAFDGTLGKRYADPPALPGAGVVRAKTGSLDNVSTLAGVVRTASGRLLVFAFAADRLPTRSVSRAAKALDVAAAALAKCGCA